MTYVRIRSWHVLRTWTRVPGVGLTLCGRRNAPEALTSETLPAEKSCESCARIVLWNEERQAGLR